MQTRPSHSFLDRCIAGCRRRCGVQRRTEAETPSAVETVRSVPVRTATVQTRDLAETLTLTGTLDPRAQVTVVPEVSARARARAQERRRSRRAAAQLLAVLDDTDFRLARDRAKAHARRGRGEPCARPGREGSRRQPAEDRRHHRQGSSVGAGGRAGGRGVARAGAQRAGDCRAAARRARRSRRRSRPHREASRRRRHDVAVGTPDLHDRRRLGVRVPLVGGVRRFRQGAGRRDRHRDRGCAAGLRRPRAR